MGMPAGDMYFESTTNTTFPFRNSTSGGLDVNGDGTVDNRTGTASSQGNSGFTHTVSMLSPFLAVGVAVVASLL